ncbi:glycosyltransferase [Kineosporia babensis]|uniref:Glycosyltransferase n=1 Tax=Kineosporia babensis TaxID=499548 RepID=A0A9X1NAB9_9ACTN|nr:glycosyltransferase [Kineosporia babensis]MCD5311287.1 glycosyltransferase [Kineosporia babensis]
MSVFFSVIVPSYNGLATLGRTLQSLEQQTYPAERFEVIVVDDGSAQDLSPVVRPFRARYRRLPVNRGVAAARNAGLELAVGDVVVGLDDDCVADPDWLRELAKGFRSTDVVGAGGVLRATVSRTNPMARYLAAKESGTPPLSSSSPGHSLGTRLLSYLRQNRTAPPAPGEIVEVAEIYGGNAAFRTDVLRSVGGWDETMSGVEDTDLCRRIKLRRPGARLVSVAGAVVAHEPHMTALRMVRRALRRGPVTLAYYRRNGFVPPIFPTPFVVLLGTLGLAWFDRHLWIAAPLYALLTPQLLYPWWAHRAWQSRRPHPLLYPYLQLLEESAVVAGLLRGYLQRKPRVAGYAPLRSWLTRTVTMRRIGVTDAEKHAHQEGPEVWLTFDDHGSPEQVERVLQILAEHQVRAMFFLVGDWAEQHPGLLAEISRAGHVLGNHTYSHQDLIALPPTQREEEILKGVPGRLLRPPMGRYNNEVRALAHDKGYQIAYWSVDSDDWQGVSEDYIHAKVVREARPGSVILFHLHAENTLNVLPRVIAGLRARNLVLAAGLEATIAEGSP